MTPRRVLVVDDEGMIRRLIRTVLEADDYEVIEANEAISALALAETERPDVIVLDVMMAGIDGLEVCRRLDHATTKVIMLTARDEPGIEDQARECGADAFMTKPFSPIELLDVIDDLLGT